MPGRPWAWGLALASCLLLAGCASGSPTPAVQDASAPGVLAAAPATGAPSSAATPDSSVPQSSDAPLIGMLLPSQSPSGRWGDGERTLLERAFAAQGLRLDVRRPDAPLAGTSAAGDESARYAEQLVRAGAKALVLAGSSQAATAGAITVAKGAGIPVIELDHLSPGAQADYYIGPDPRALGQVLGEGLLRCLRDERGTAGSVALLNGPSADPVAAEVKQEALAAMVRAAVPVRISADLPSWQQEMSASVMDQVRTAARADLVGVAAASDELAAQAIRLLEADAAGSSSGLIQVQVAGVGSSPDALARVLDGRQCLTAFTSAKAEAQAASLLVAALAIEDVDAVAGLASERITDPASGRQVPSVFLQPQPVFAMDVPAMVEAGLVSAAALCRQVQQSCRRAGIEPP